jgi:GTPase
LKFVDQVRVLVHAGDGGDGSVAWRREAHVPKGGPAGGDGGRGGDVVLVADAGLSTLLDLRFRQRLIAEHGRPGQPRARNGRAGADLHVRVPIGTMVFVEGPATGPDEPPPWVERGEGDDDGNGLENIYMVPDEVEDPAEENLDAILQARLAGRSPMLAPEGRRQVRPGDLPPGTLLGDLSRDGETLVLTKGGRGGRGNIHFRSSTRRSPDFAESGEPGDGLWVRLELKLLADVGIVGFPNVGKSTFIRRVSRARAKVADYPFTTLVPQLGVVTLDEDRTMVVADVPGLIEGASEGRGLGLQFLRHLERTRVLLHLLAPDFTPGREPLRDLEVIEHELAQYGDAFEGRPRVVAINKIDTLGDEEGQQRLAELRAQLRARNIPLFAVSAATGAGMAPLLDALWRRLVAVRERERDDSQDSPFED